MEMPPHQSTRGDTWRDECTVYNRATTYLAQANRVVRHDVQDSESGQGGQSNGADAIPDRGSRQSHQRTFTADGTTSVSVHTIA